MGKKIIRPIDHAATVVSIFSCIELERAI